MDGALLLPSSHLSCYFDRKSKTWSYSSLLTNRELSGNSEASGKVGESYGNFGKTWPGHGNLVCATGMETFETRLVRIFERI